ncbi:unnamed protein product [Arctia plantaginis]|uniref:G-protein coupled receptor n=1 Tax=Arctia plantaginis TaxID=874455 RepID=A0A8S0Z477_ARCPL|nr:unnamed protein product [Arctia plantaginis]
MLSSTAYLLLVSIATKVKSDEVSQAKWSDLQNSSIKIPITEYCKNKTCLVKCCPDGRVMSSSGIGPTCVHLRVNYTAFNKYIQDHSSREVKFIQNEIFSDTNKTITLMDSDIYISKDGSLKSQSYNRKSLEYCVDFYYEGDKSSSMLVFRIIPDPFDQHANRQEFYVAAAILISSLLTLFMTLMYAVLPRLQHLTGMMFTTSLISLLVGFVIKLITLIYTTLDITLGDTASLTVYYFLLSCCCWLSLTPYDLWFTLRHSRRPARFGWVRRRPHREALLKMIWACSYGWGVPALLTLYKTINDKQTQYNNVSYKPLFENHAYGMHEAVI